MGGEFFVKNKTLKLSDTRWTCSSCNTLHDKNINTSLNLGLFLLQRNKNSDSFCLS